MYDFDATMDALLRRHAQGRSEPAVAAHHLDPDEMNAYAENALPAATRLHYLAHLADCAACRQMVTELTLAAGVTFQEEPSGVAIKPPTMVAAKTSWREWWAALLNPAVLRYAAPAVLLLAVTVGAFLTLQTSRDAAPPNTEVARSAQADAPVPSSNQVANTNQPENVSKTAQPLPGLPPPAVAPGQNVAPPAGKSAEVPPLATGGKKDVTAPVREAAPDAAEGEGIRAQPAPALRRSDEEKAKASEAGRSGSDLATGVTADAAPAPKPAATPPPQDDRAEERQRATTAVAPGARAGGPSKSADTGSGKATPPPAAPMRKKPRQDEDDNAKKERDATPETRNVGGRTFTRRGNTWIDNACAGGCATTTLRRGSEDYQKADAGLRAIADQLGGEVVVVWKGKAYRIQ